jgi:hypothetical protein
MAKRNAPSRTRAEDPNMVRLAVKENRKLSPDEVAEFAVGYRAGATQVELAERFGVHESESSFGTETS